MSSLFARLAVVGAFAVVTTACSNGYGTSLPFAGPPNNGGGSTGTFQSGGNSIALLRFIQGSPDKFSTFGGPPPSGTVDVCIDNLPFGVTFPAINYGQANPVLYAIPGGIAHTVSVFPTLGGVNVGLECPTAPGPYLGTAAISVTTINPGIGGNPNRLTIVLGGTAASGTRGLYVFGEPSFAITPGTQAISHNAAPAFSLGKALGIGFGICSVTVTPCTVASALVGAQGVAAPTAATANASVVNANVASSLGSIPAGFYDGIGVPAANPVPITSVAAPAQVAGQPYVIQLYAIDAVAGGLNLVPFVEQTLGFGF